MRIGNLIVKFIVWLVELFANKNKSIEQPKQDEIPQPIKPIQEVAVEETKPEKLQEFPVINIIKSLPTAKDKFYASRTLDKIKQIVIHHSLTTTGTAASFARYHIEARGWPGIGYHIVIDKKGQIFLTNYFKTVSYHVDNANTKSLGICLVGNYDEEQPPQIQIDALRYILQETKKSLPQKLDLVRHHDFSQKSCPGTNMEPIFKQLKQEFNESYNQQTV